ncbi:hypothetical protein H5P28_06850 [Ruficoccus amylovorans]|uniref:Polyhydroxyalkanoate synthesis regulator phasin n=1 Tax=Ruficoccus amylovorans TaxID=1804625 RepID=A0A842HEH4_9BACT|nr:hypothetical protein [Ruficoccus amylovorans]MBC2593977.1 hypothetical protein [Ruficoccus amylovorans]
MIDLIKKGMLAAVGAAVVTKEQAEGLLNEFVDKGKITAGEAQEMASKIADSGKAEFEKAKKQINARIDEMLQGGVIVTRVEIEALEKRVAALEKAAKKAD